MGPFSDWKIDILSSHCRRPPLIIDGMGRRNEENYRKIYCYSRCFQTGNCQGQFGNRGFLTNLEIANAATFMNRNGLAG